jgi:hypothetical protein
MKHSKILKAIRKDVEAEDREFICLGLMEFEYTASEANAWEILERIEAAMGEWAGLGVCQWLHDKAGIPIKEITSSRLKEYRLNWLDQLIAEYEEMGK